VKKFLLLVMVLCAVLIYSTGAYALEIRVDNYSAYDIFMQGKKVGNQDISSDAGFFYNRTTASLTDYDNERFEGELRCGMGFSSRAKEQWRVDGADSQSNKLSFWDIDTGILLGWAVPIDTTGRGYIERFDMVFSPLVGYRWKYTAFMRRDRIINRAIPAVDILAESYNVQSVDVGCRFNIRVEDKFNLYTKPVLGIVLFNSMNNSAAGNTEGDGGISLNCDSGIEYPIMENLMLNLTCRTELQYLRGGEKNGRVWLDNYLYSFGGDIGLIYEF